MQGHVSRYFVPTARPKVTSTASHGLGKVSIPEPWRAEPLVRYPYILVNLHTRGRMISKNASDHFGRHPELEIGPAPVGGRA